MADKNQLKIADQVDLADDDPFAELTRIMGFDPRQPARQAQQPAAAPEPVGQTAEADDFSLDLEKELLGEFAALEDEFAVEDEAPEAEAAAPAEVPHAETAVAEAEAVQAPEADAEVPEVDFDFGAELGAALAASHEPGLPDEPDAELDLGLTEDDVLALDVEATDPVLEAETNIDFGLTEDDIIRSLDEEAQPAPVEAASHAPAEDAVDADLDAAMADIDMDFGDAFAVEPVEAAPAGESPEIAEAAAEATDDDLHLFDEADFRLEEEAAEEPAVEATPEPEIDESAIDFSEDEFRLEDAHPVEEPPVTEEAPSVTEQAAEPAADDFSFDDIDFAAEEFSAEPEAAEYEAQEPVAAEASSDAEPVAEEPRHAEAPALPSEPPKFEFVVPRYEPRKLPVSPMDIAAEEYRQREAAAQPAEPAFNLEDELNALLGNIRSGQAATSNAPLPVSPAAEAPQPEQPLPAYEASRQAPYEPPSFRAEPSHYAPEPISFDPPAHPADIEDDLSWDLDDAFAAEAPEPAVNDAYEAEDRYDAYADAGLPEDFYDGPQQPEDLYAQAPEADDLASLDFDDLSFEPVTEEPPSTTRYGQAAAGAAASFGSAPASFGSAPASRPFGTAASPGLSDLPRAPAGDWSAERSQQAAADAYFNPHRDPVVRGNPLKEDPLDVITQLAEKYSRKEPVTPYGRAMGVARGGLPFAEDPAADQGADEDIDISSAFDEQPEVETIEVSDQAVALADDLDIPELPPEEELPPVAAYDDLDAEFSSLINDMNAEARTAWSGGGQGGSYAGFEQRPFENQTVGSPHLTASKTYDDDPEPDSFALDIDDLPGSRVPSGGQYAAADYDYDPDMDQEIAPHLAAESNEKPKSRGLLLAGLVGGVALIGAIGAFALSYGGGDSDAPALVRADDGPVKVKPENPGGVTVPNQENKVYETVAGETRDAPQQEKLVTTVEEPVDVTPPAMEEEDVAVAPSGKNEDRIEQIVREAENQTDDELVAVAPRKVRTMVVKPDGTLVEREDEPGEPAGTVAAAVPAPAAPESTGALPAAPKAATAEVAPQPALDPAPQETTAAAEEEGLPPVEDEIAAAVPAEDEGVLPETAPIAPPRPAEQPIDVVGEVKPDQVAAATTAAPGGNWAMQIASQPSEAAAQSSYRDLARRYANVLQGREVNIVKAEIAGKGTFWRVRVPAASRNEAISLCENYKAAGGNCFVSR